MTAIPFAITPLEVITDRRLLASDLRVLLGLLTYADAKTLECFPKRETLAARIGLSVQRVQQVLTRLADLGWIERQRTGRATTYRITPPTLDQEATTAPQEAVPAPMTGFLSESNPGLSIASNVIEQTTYQTIPPSPPALATLDQEATPIDQERQRQEQQERELERQRQRDQEREARQQRHLARQERRLARRMEREATPPGSHQGAVQRVLSVFQTVCNVTYPNSGAIAGKVSKAIEQHGEETLTRVIKHRGASFRFPLALLRDDLIESINAEISRPTPEPGATQEKPRERRWFGIPESIIVKHARPGEDFETVAYRLLDEQRRNSTMRA